MRNVSDKVVEKHAFYVQQNFPENFSIYWVMWRNVAGPVSFFNVLLTVHLGITLVNDQPDAQIFFFIIRLLQSSTFFEQRRAHHQEVKLY